MGDLRAGFRNTIFSQLSLVQTPVDFQTGLYLIDPRIHQLNEIQVEQKQLIRRIISSIRMFRKQNVTASQSFLDLCKKIVDFISSKETNSHHWKLFLLFLIDEARSESCLYELFPPDQFEELHAHIIQLRRPNYYEIGHLRQREMVPFRQETSSEHEMECLIAKQMFESSTYKQRTQYLFHLLMTYPKDFLRLMKSRLLLESLQYLEHSRETTGLSTRAQEEQQLEISLLNVQLRRLPVPGRLSRIKTKIQRLCTSNFFMFFISCFCIIAFYMLLRPFKESSRAVVLIPEDETLFSVETLISKETQTFPSVANLIEQGTTRNYESKEGGVLDTNSVSVEEELQSTKSISKGNRTKIAIFRFVWKYIQQVKLLIPLSMSMLALYWYISRAVEHKKKCAHRNELGRHRWFLRSSCPYCQSERASRRTQ
ncbi:hypothetical protein Gasu2_09640 [Galdieria sulphuraria]|uniref:Uncharacterized protein n=1 Tax=Galdieria sulphuraria TaxID=130081 RepID=M2X4P2_GALSU|nr:uncharacterized protein Gasu_13640 [Galdieria sulphuraria]EME31400.1 hypothetical protein Gasu_13640 [Galdieria sulphuraria]GJD06554.1 hypothetical protein Gasu2_09640 [Galdieria sulphuraria]|eukprot:XP_005707920.1 hypothetical protein Gasu_13640 [Galdieria sulphuraria]